MIMNQIKRTCMCGREFLGYSGSKYCVDCKRVMKNKKKIISKFGTLDVELKCVVCGYEGVIDEITGHHVISRKIDLESEKVALCGACHYAIHIIRKSQKKLLSEEGLRQFERLVNQCTTRHYWR